MCYCVPLLLQSNLAEKLNHKIIANTGCFAFLKTDQLMMYKAAASAQDAFMAYSVCLYSLYHDYGKQFLKILLCDEFCPSDTLRRKSLPLKKHVTVIQYIIRPNFTHAFFDTAKRDDLIHSLAEYYLRGCSTQTPTGQWPDFLNCLDDDQWIYIANRLIQDADNLYRFLDDWADEWKGKL
jgi:hypothetical protein